MYDAVVLGAGVYGLSIARELDNRGLRVAIIARDLPEDWQSTGFASPWAGCNWCSFETSGDAPGAEWDRITFNKFEILAKEHPELCKRIPFYSVWQGSNDEVDIPWFKDLVGDFKVIEGTPQSPLPGNYPHGISYTSYILHAPAYIAHLGKEVRARGIPIFRHRLSALDEAYDFHLTGKVDLVINSLSLGNKTLIGVEDDKMYPARGQTVLVKAPAVKTCIMATESFNVATPKAGSTPLPGIAYIIPRPGSEGHVVLGGTYIKDNYSTLPDLAEAERILKACYDLEPALAGPLGKSWKDIEIVSHNVGLRPARVGGARLELEYRDLGSEATLAPRATRSGPQRRVAVVHAYGPGGAGFQSSLGIAEKAADLAVSFFRTRLSAAKL